MNSAETVKSVKLNKETKTDVRVFYLLMFLFLVSFFEETQIRFLTLSALFATLSIPLVIFVHFIFSGARITKTEKKIMIAFAVLMAVQLLNIRLDDLYGSITPVYRSFSCLMIVLYMRRLNYSWRKSFAVVVITFITVILGFLTIFTPIKKDSNVLFGNYNTIGVLFFTLAVLNLISYYKLRKLSHLFAMVLCLALIVISVTRTALMLFIIMLLLWWFFTLISKGTKRIIRPQILYPLLLIILIGFIYVYYEIKSMPFYDWINSIFRKLFNKNFDSGRPDLWHLTVETVGNSWLFGKGTGIDLEFFYSYLKTPHSVFFDFYLQNGILGVAVYCVCILTVIKAKGKWTKNSFSILLLVIVFIILFYNSLGIVFTKARSGIGLMQWGLIALQYCQFNKEKSKGIKKNDKSYSSGLQCQRIY